MTKRIRTDPERIDSAVIRAAAAVLRRGGLVAFPTETVYGLGANALDSAAVQRIFEAKGRPATNPIIVHVADTAAAQCISADWPPLADELARQFWPGPLTLVLRKNPAIPDNVTAGGPTVAVRAPAHPVARALLDEARLPIAAPSANRSTEVSPTTAEHVAGSLGGRIDLILDGGPCTGGIESTVLDVTCDPPRLLRPGLITIARIEAIAGSVHRVARADSDQPLPSPGLMQRHYSPRAPLVIADDAGARLVAETARYDKSVGWVTWPDSPAIACAVRIDLPREPLGYAAGLYAALHRMDAAGVEHIIVARPPEGDDWLAIHDRLSRASGPRTK